MAAKKKFTVVVDGETFTRTSQTMDYKFAIVGQLDVEKDRKAAYEYDGKHDRTNYNYYVALVNRTHEHANPARMTWLKPEQAEVHVSETIAHAITSLGGAKTFEEYVEVQRQRAIKRFELSLANGAYRRKVISWSQSHTAAHSRATEARRHYINVTVEPVN